MLVVFGVVMGLSNFLLFMVLLGIGIGGSVICVIVMVSLVVFVIMNSLNVIFLWGFSFGIYS